MSNARQRAKERAELEILLRDSRVVKMAMARLVHPLKLAKAAADKEAAKRNARAEKLAGYESPEEAAEAFGYGSITEEEYRRICDLFEGISHEEEISEEEAAYKILLEFHRDLAREARNYDQEAMAIQQKHDAEFKVLAGKYREKQEAEHDAGN